MTNAMINFNATTIEAVRPQIRSTTSTERFTNSSVKKMIAFKVDGTMQCESAGKFYSRFIEDNDLVTVEIGEFKDSMMFRIFKYMLVNGIVIANDKCYAVNDDRDKAGTFEPKDSMEIIKVNNAMSRYEICWVTTSQINSKTLLFCKAEKRKNFENLISPGYTHEELAAGVLKDVMSFASRMNMCSGAIETVKNSSASEIGIVVVNEKPKYRDGQFYGYIPLLKDDTAYQFRVFNGAGKGMLLNSKKLFHKHLAKALSKECFIVGNPENICMVMDMNSYKLDPAAHVIGECHIMSEAHTSEANATEETVKALVQKGYDKRELQKSCEDELINAVDEATVSKDSGYILQAFAGINHDATKKLVDNALNRATFRFGAKYVKLLQTEDDIIVRFKTVDNKKYICVDAPGAPEGLTLLERKPSTSMAESIIVYNFPGCYSNVFANTVMLPSCEYGLDMATCLGGADYDGDGVFIGHDESIVKEMAQNGYEHKTIEVMPEPAANVTIKSYAELLYFLYTQQSANINKVVGTFKKFQFATQESLVDVFAGNCEVPEFGREISFKDVSNATIVLSNGVKLNSSADIEKLRKTIMEIARYMAETEIGFGKKGIHAPADVFKFFCSKAKKVNYDPSYDIDWNAAKRYAEVYVNCFFTDNRLLNKEDVIMTTSATNIAKTMSNVMRAKMNGHKLATLGFDAMIRSINDPVLTEDCVRASFSKGYETSLMTDECLETLGYEVIDKNYNLNAVTVNIGRRIEPSAIGAKVHFSTDGKGHSWMENSKSKALVFGPMPKEKDTYEIIDVFNCDEFTVIRDGVSKTFEQTVVILKKV